MPQRPPTWDATIDAALALFIGAGLVGGLAYCGLTGSVAGSPGLAAYALLALSLATFVWSAVRARARNRAASRAARGAE